MQLSYDLLVSKRLIKSPFSVYGTKSHTVYLIVPGWLPCISASVIGGYLLSYDPGIYFQYAWVLTPTKYAPSSMALSSVFFRDSNIVWSVMPYLDPSVLEPTLQLRLHLYWWPSSLSSRTLSPLQHAKYQLSLTIPSLLWFSL